MTRNRVQIELDLESRKAQRELSKTAKEARELSDDLEESESAGKALARAIEDSADSMIREIDETADAVRAMERQLDGTDLNPQQVVAALKAMGLEAREVEADAEALARAFQRADDIDMHAASKGFDDVSLAVGSVADETGRAHDVGIGYIGGMAGELPIISDALGPVGEGVGQLTEGFLEGEIAVKDLVKTGLGMAAIGAVVMGVNAAMQSLEASRAFERQQIEDYTEAIREVGEGVDAVNETLLDSEQILGRVGGIAGFFEDEMDIVPALAAVGLTWNDVSVAIADGGAAMEKVTDTIRAHQDEMMLAAAGVDTGSEAWFAATNEVERYDLVLQVLNDQNSAYVAGVEEAAARTDFFGTATSDAASAHEQLESTLDDVVAAANEARRAEEQLTEELEANTEAARANEQAVEDAADARRAAVDATFAVRDAQADLLKTFAETDEALPELEEGSLDYQRALDDVAESAGSLADAEVRRAEEMAAANDETLKGSEELDILNRSLLTSAQSANGPMRQAIVNYVASLNGIPDETATEILALIDEGKLDEANAKLNTASTERQALIRAEADTANAEQILDNAARDRSVVFHATTVGDLPSTRHGRHVAFASGTKGAPPHGVALVGEQGPEFVRMPTGTEVTPAAETARMMSGGGTTNVTVNLPPGLSPDAVAESLRRFNRRNGR